MNLLSESYRSGFGGDKFVPEALARVKPGLNSLGLIAGPFCEVDHRFASRLKPIVGDREGCCYHLRFVSVPYLYDVAVRGGVYQRKPVGPGRQDLAWYL